MCHVTDVISVLTERGLAFWGYNKVVGSPHRVNFLGILELLAQFDPFISAHIKKHYNKSTICEEFTIIKGTQV